SCEASITIDISSVTFCTDCVLAVVGAEFEFEDINVLSGSPYTAFNGASTCVAPDCIWSVNFGDQPQIVHHEWHPASGCTGAPTSDENINVQIVAGRIGGTYYALARAFPNVTGLGG